jgi:phosphoribosylglycinamide formyltransferase-1
MKFSKPRLGILGSGSGTNFAAIQAKIESGDLPAKVCVVVADNYEAKIVDKAKAKGIPAFVVEDGKDTRDTKILEYMSKYQVDLVFLLGYIKLIREPLISEYNGRIINIHPGPLPETGGKGMFGLAVHQKVLDQGLKESAVVMHYVNGKFDEGEIIAQAPVPVELNDTAKSLRDRVMQKEYEFYWKVIKDKFCND